MHRVYGFHTLMKLSIVLTVVRNLPGTSTMISISLDEAEENSRDHRDYRKLTAGSNVKPTQSHRGMPSTRFN